MLIPFTQYMRPHGRQVDVTIDMPNHVGDAAYRFIEGGGRYEAEILTTGHVSLTAVMPIDGDPTDIAIEVVPNGPGMKEAVERLVKRSVECLDEEVNA